MCGGGERGAGEAGEAEEGQAAEEQAQEVQAREGQRQEEVARVLLTALAALLLAPAAHAGGPELAIGAAEDVVRQPTLVGATAQMTLLRLAGFRAVRVTSIWAPGLTRPGGGELRALRNVAAAARFNGVQVYVSVYHYGSRTTPLTERARRQFASYAASLVRGVPAIRDVIVGNEPNLNRFWLPQFNANGSNAAAPAYLALLARTYDAVKEVSLRTRVWGGALAPRGSDRYPSRRHTHSPTRFLRDLGAAYRASRRRSPVMDGLAFHPYQDTSRVPPELAHPNVTTIAIADYEKLVRLLGRTFDGTAQQGSTLPILYSEFGVETRIPARKRVRYHGREPAATVSEARQAAYYRRAIALAFCQPNVVAMLLFHTRDEPALSGWQSGVYYVDGTPKSSIGAVRFATRAVRGGVIARCEGLKLTPHVAAVTWPEPQEPVRMSLACTIDCLYDARLVRLPDREIVLETSGRLRVDDTGEIVFPDTPLDPGEYRVVVTLRAPVNAGAPSPVAGPVFTLS